MMLQDRVKAQESEEATYQRHLQELEQEIAENGKSSEALKRERDELLEEELELQR